jgi:L-ascorbate metabolism protein UlaG (beta-lactamase superfamily)
MKRVILFLLFLFTFSNLLSQNVFEYDIIKTKSGDLKITFIGHGTIMFEIANTVIHVDPVGRYADYSKLLDADLILITHHHGDHLDPNAIKEMTKEGTKIFCNELSLEKAVGAIVLKNGENVLFGKINIEAVPAYNILHKRDNGDPFHPKGQGNGYVLTIADKKIYIAGDTENIPEMKELKNIDIAFLPMNLPYTMTPQMVVDAVKMFNPKILYPYHFGNTNVNELIELLKEKNDCEVRIRKLN